MASLRPPPHGEQPTLQSVRRGRLGGWRITALVISALAVGTIYVGRFGLPDLDAPAASAPPSTSASPTAAADATTSPVPAEPSGRPAPSIGPTTEPTPTPALRPSARLSRFRDGIPGYIGDEHVVRPADVVDRTSGARVLLGGWMIGNRLADDPGFGGAVFTVGGEGGPTGPVVLRGSFGPGELSFTATDVVWTGDAQTDSAPIAVAPLIEALGTRFGQDDPFGPKDISLGLADVALDCQVAWPRHSYAGNSGPVLLLFVFSSPADRMLNELPITQSQYPDGLFEGFDPSCPYPAARVTGRTRWLVDGNVMMLIRSGDRNTGLAREALADARAASDLLEPRWRPVSTWQTLRALWTVYPGVDVAPPAEEMWCVEGLPSDHWSIRHRWVRGMAIFDSTAEREEFQATADPANVRLERGECSGLGGQQRLEGARWIGAENVLLMVIGPELIDALLEAAIPRSRVPYR